MTITTLESSHGGWMIKDDRGRWPKKRMLHVVDGDYTISENQVWLPGCYDTIDTALAAFDHPDAELQALQDGVNASVTVDQRRVITMDMLRTVQP